MSKRLKISSGVEIFDETDGLVLFEKTKSGFWSTTSDMGARIYR